MKLSLETLEVRVMPSATTETQPYMADVTARMVSMVEERAELIAVVDHNLVNFYDTLIHNIVQEWSYFGQQLDHLLGVSPPSSGSGSGSGATTTAHDDPNPPLDPSTPESSSDMGSGSGMGSGSNSCSMYNRIVQFEQASVFVPEESGMCSPSTATLAVSVQNTNPNCPAISVNYATQDGTATTGTDYTAESGTLSFAPGDSGPDYITIPILDDGDDESVGSESFYVNLSDPVNAMLGNPSTATVNIDEGPQERNTDTLRWNPCMGNNASTVQNWYDVTQGFQLQKGALGLTGYNPIQFDADTADTPNSNAPITWDKGFNVASISLYQYTGKQTINSNVTVESNGAGGTSLSMDNSSWLSLAFASSTSTFKIDNNATITNMQLTGNNLAQLEIAGGTTTMAGATGLTESLGVMFKIDSGAIVNYQNNNTLLLTQDKIRITVDGEMDLYYGNNNQNTVIGGGATFTNDYIDVEGGTLAYYGKQNIVDTITVPIYVNNGGWFAVTTPSSVYGGKLIVQGGNSSTQDVSVFMNGSSSVVSLNHNETLECDNGYYEITGTLETTYSTTGCTLQAGNTGAGTVTIGSSGAVIIEQDNFGYSTLNVNATTLNLNGELVLAIDAQNPPKCSLLNVTGTTNLQAASSSLTVYDNNGPPAAGLGRGSSSKIQGVPP